MSWKVFRFPNTYQEIDCRPPTLVTPNGRIEKLVHQSTNLIVEKMFSKKKCLERVSNVSYGSLENAPKKKDDTLFHFFDFIWFWDKILWSLFSSLDFNNHFFYYMFTEPFTRGIDSTSEHFSKLWELWWTYYMLH